MSALQAVTALASAFVVWWAVKTAHHMTSQTCHIYRLGVVLVGAAALSTGLAPLYDEQNLWIRAALMVGIGLVCAADRRSRRRA